MGRTEPLVRFSREQTATGKCAEKIPGKKVDVYERRSRSGNDCRQNYTCLMPLMCLPRAGKVRPIRRTVAMVSQFGRHEVSSRSDREKSQFRFDWTTFFRQHLRQPSLMRALLTPRLQRAHTGYT